MRKSAQQVLRGTIAACAFFVFSPAHAGSFEDGIASTYESFRTAATYLRTGNAGLASLDLAEAQDVWSEIEAVAVKSPPAAFANDPKFAETLSEVSTRLAEALTLAENGEAKQAHQTIIPIRGLIYELRQRNGQRVYADCITEFNATMDRMWIYRHNPPDFAKAEVKSHASEVQTEYLRILAECIEMAPASYKKNEEFQRLTQSTQRSTGLLGDAIKAKDTSGYISILRELRSFDRIIFFKFGS